MSYVGYGQPQYRPEPKVRFDAIGEAWGLTRDKMGVWALTMLVYFLITNAISYGLAFLGQGMGLVPTQGNQITAGFVVFEIVLILIMMVVSGFFMAGLFRMALKQVRGHDIAVGDLFDAGDAVGAAIITQLVYGIATFLGMLLCLIPGFIVAGRGMLSLPLAVDKGRAGLDGFQGSWEALKKDTLNAILFLIAVGIVSSLGGFLCGIGILFTFPIYPLAIAIVYRDFFDVEGSGNGPSLNMPLPPQSAYGPGNYNPTGMTPPPPGRAMDVPPTPGQTPPGQNPPPPGQMGRIDM